MGSIFQSRGIESLDLLRGIAAWSVAFAHFVLFSGNDSILSEFIASYAVEVFFALSGFVLGPQLTRCVSHPTMYTLRVFWLRRWLRTIPIFILFLVLVSIINQELFSKEFFYYASFIFYFFKGGAGSDYFLLTWSLAVEEWYYLSMPLFLIFCLRVKLSLRLSIFIFIIISAIAKIIYVIEYGNVVRRITYLRLDAIAFGYLSYLMYDRYKRAINSLWIWFVAVFSSIASYMAFIFDISIIFVYASAIGSCSIVLAFADSSWNQLAGPLLSVRIVASKFAALLAHTSYCTYLAHFLLFQLFYDPILSLGYNILLFSSSIILISILSFFIIEKPFMSLRPSFGHDSIDENYHKT